MGLASVANSHSLKDFGGIEGEDTTRAAQANARAFANAFDAATQRHNDDNTIVIPEGETYTLFPVLASNFHDVKVVIDGTILCGSDQINWTSKPGKRGHAYNMFHLTDGENLEFTGKGVVEGRGFAWWVRQWLQTNPHQRPHLMYMNRVEHVTFRGIEWRNSPMYHFLLEDINDFDMRDF